MTESATVPQPPRTLRSARLVVGAQIVLTLISAALFWGYTSERSQQLVDANAKLTKNKKVPYTATEIAHDLHQVRVGVTVQSIVVCILFALAAFSFWHGRGIARWLYIAASVVFSIGGILALGQSGPAIPNAVSFLVSLTAIAAIVLLIMPDSTRFFAAYKVLRTPPAVAAARAGAAPRPMGLRGLFAPPPPRVQDGSAGAKPAAKSGGKGSRNNGSAASAARNPAATRPAGSNPGAGAGAATPADAADKAARRKSKVRANPADVVAPPVEAAVPVADSAGARSRGKSRRG